MRRAIRERLAVPAYVQRSYNGWQAELQRAIQSFDRYFFRAVIAAAHGGLQRRPNQGSGRVDRDRATRPVQPKLRLFPNLNEKCPDPQLPIREKSVRIPGGRVHVLTDAVRNGKHPIAKPDVWRVDRAAARSTLPEFAVGLKLYF